jgi:hypothetical protein
MTQPDELTQKIQELLRSVSALAELRQQLERLVGQRVVSVQGNVSGSVIVIGDSNQITLGDGGQLADLWRDLQLDDQAAAERYRERVAALYDHLTFPLSGLSFGTILKDVYQPLQAAPVSDLTRWQQAERAVSDRRRETDDLLADERPVALLGLLGGGKTTTLRYLTWAYASRPDDLLLWRGDELLPFYVTARDLAAAWQGDTPFLAACAAAAAQTPGHALFSTHLARRVLERALEQGAALLLVDALDEYRAPDAARADLLRALSAQWTSDPFRRNSLILTSRPHAYLKEERFQAYALQVLEAPRLERLAYRLGSVLLRELGERGDALESKLDNLTGLALSPQMRDFASPFYVTLFTLAVCRSERFNEGLAQARRIGRLADLYHFFLRQTIRWEQNKPDSPDIDERAALLALAELGWQTFAAPPWQEWLAPDLLSEAERRAAMSFWQRSGLLQKDEFRGEWVFSHSGFQLFGAALRLHEAWRRGQHEGVRRLHQETERLPDWDTVWELFLGLEPQDGTGLAG